MMMRLRAPKTTRASVAFRSSWAGDRGGGGQPRGSSSGCNADSPSLSYSSLVRRGLFCGCTLVVVVYALVEIWPIISGRSPCDHPFWLRASSFLPLPSAAAYSGPVPLLQLDRDLLERIQSFPSPNGHHNPYRRRNVISLTGTPFEIERLRVLVNEQLLKFGPYTSTFDAIHLSIPDASTRFPQHRYPSTVSLQEMFPDCRVVIHRLPDFGPLTRYIGPLSYEQNPETNIVVFDIDSQGMDYQIRGRQYKRAPEPVRDIAQLVSQSQRLDPDALWCLQGENFSEDADGQIHPAWDTFEIQKDDQSSGTIAAGGISWNEGHFCRAASGTLFKPRLFEGFWFNQTSYDISCLWDDDRWIGFQMERLRYGHLVDQLC